MPQLLIKWKIAICKNFIEYKFNKITKENKTKKE